MGTFPSLLALLFVSTLARAAAPGVSNIRAAQRAGTKLVDIYYDVSDTDGTALTVEIQVSNDNGSTYSRARVHLRLLQRYTDSYRS